MDFFEVFPDAPKTLSPRELVQTHLRQKGSWAVFMDEGEIPSTVVEFPTEFANLFLAHRFLAHSTCFPIMFLFF